MSFGGFSLIDLDGPWGWSKLTSDELITLRKKGKEWEKLRHNEFFNLPRNKPTRESNPSRPEAT